VNDKELNDGVSGATRRQTVAPELGGGVVRGGCRETVVRWAVGNGVAGAPPVPWVTVRWQSWRRQLQKISTPHGKNKNVLGPN
jgi:hypothetical protein